MNIKELRQSIMQHRTEQGLAVILTTSDHKPVTLYFASLASRDDFMRRAVATGAAVEIATS